ncbi:MAG: hypothetical protein EAZ42_07310 [Verrucomicrobia bacterium]|nr:MAG: hypothetical protein EAZ42_07310 [Verrucomicrobiota bacterium]
MEPFKNQFAIDKARAIGQAIQRVDGNFQLANYLRGLEKELEPIELKARVGVIARRIRESHSGSIPELFSTLAKTLAADADDQNGLSGFLVWPLTDVVACHGLDHFEPSMAALGEMTSRFTAEFAIRPFLVRERERTMRQLEKWCEHPNAHLRRLVSEGSRPLLPWGERLDEMMDDPNLTIGLLNRLYQDPSDYVRLSVSNHLNDMSKRHPDWVIDQLVRWRDSGAGGPLHQRLERHACRTMIKRGLPRALTFLGYPVGETFEVDLELVSREVKIGDALSFRIQIRHHAARPLRVMWDYAIFHRNARGTHAPKIFKGRSREIAPGEPWQIEARHSFRPVTTRVYHAGEHYLALVVNGKPFPQQAFLLNSQ